MKILDEFISNKSQLNNQYQSNVHVSFEQGSKSIINWLINKDIRRNLRNEYDKY